MVSWSVLKDRLVLAAAIRAHAGSGHVWPPFCQRCKCCPGWRHWQRCKSHFARLQFQAALHCGNSGQPCHLHRLHALLRHCCDCTVVSRHARLFMRHKIDNISADSQRVSSRAHCCPAVVVICHNVRAAEPMFMCRVLGWCGQHQ